MGLFNILDPALDFVFGPLLNISYIVFLLVMSFFISLGIILLTKYTTNQALMKELRDEMKSYQNEIKTHKSNPSKALELQKKAMEKNMEYMKHSFRATIYSFIPIIILLGWVAATAGYVPIKSNEQFNITIIFNKGFNANTTIAVPAGFTLLSSETAPAEDGTASWKLKSGKEGSYDIDFKSGQETFSKEVVVSELPKHNSVLKKKKGIFDFIYGSREGYLDADSIASQIVLSNRASKPFGSISLFGWHPGWLGTYILLSIVFTMGLRKLLKVY